MNRIDALTDDVTKLLDKQEALARLRNLDDAIGIVRDLRRDMIFGYFTGPEMLERAQIRLEKQAARICSDAISSGSGAANEPDTKRCAQDFRQAVDTASSAVDTSREDYPLPDSNEGSVADGIIPTESSTLISAAPELYEALKRIVAELPTRRDWLDPLLENEAKAALKKARGE